MAKQVDAAFLKLQYGVSAASVTPLKSNVALLLNEKGEKTIFKCARTDKGGSLIDRFRFRNEIRMYRILNKANFHFLNTPTLFDAGKNHIIIDFIERDEGIEVTEADFAKAYYELQNLKVPPSAKFDLLNQVTRGVWYRGIVVPLITLTRFAGLKKSLAATRLFLNLHLKSKRLKTRYWLHGDLAVRNVYYHLKDHKLFFIDFENMYFTRNWPLLEIVQRCVWYEGDEKASFCIDLNTLNHYLQEAEKHQNSELLNINLAKQFRISLLINCVGRIIRPKTKIKTKAYTSLLNVVLDDKSYQSWFTTYIEPLLQNKKVSKEYVSIKDLGNNL